MTSIDYEYQGKKFTMSKPEACTMKIARDGVEVTVSPNESTGMFNVSQPDGPGSYSVDSLAAAVDRACSIILQKLVPVPTKQQLCQELDVFYEDHEKSSG